MKKLLTIFIFAMLVFSLGFAFAENESVSPIGKQCANFPGPDFCEGGIENVIVNGTDSSGCSIYSCKIQNQSQLRDGTGQNHNAVISEGGLNGTGLGGEGMLISPGPENKGNLDAPKTDLYGEKQNREKEDNAQGKGNLFRERARTQEAKSCVAGITQVKNTCYKITKEELKSCKLEAKNSEDSKEARSLCNEAYKSGKGECKANFSNERGNCIALNNPEEA